MRTEEEIRKRRNELYNLVILMKQKNDPYADLVLITVSQYDWCLGAEDNSLKPMIQLFDQLEKDKRKLAMF